MKNIKIGPRHGIGKRFGRQATVHGFEAAGGQAVIGGEGQQQHEGLQVVIEGIEQVLGQRLGTLAVAHLVGP